MTTPPYMPGRNKLLDVYVKGPAESIDIKFDWRTKKRLITGENISAAAFSATTGLTTASPTFDNDSATVWISGGSIDNDYILTCTITTNQGRTESDSVQIKVQVK